MSNDNIIEKSLKYIATLDNTGTCQSEMVQAATHLKKLLDKQLASDIKTETFQTKYKAVPMGRVHMARSIARGYGNFIV